MISKVRIIRCVKLKRDAPGLTFIPYPGPLGQKIYHTVSEEAWNGWVNNLSALMNEQNFDFSHGETRSTIEKLMQEFLCLENENNLIK